MGVSMENPVSSCTWCLSCRPIMSRVETSGVPSSREFLRSLMRDSCKDLSSHSTGS